MSYIMVYLYIYIYDWTIEFTNLNIAETGHQG